jgi:hypothetical protein
MVALTPVHQVQWKLESRSRRRVEFIGFLAFLLGVGVFLVWLNSSDRTTSRSQDLQVVGHDWSVTQYGRAIHSFTINNSGQSTYQNVVMNVHYYAKTGEPLRNETVTMSEFFPSKRVTIITIIHSASLGATRATARIAIVGAEEKTFF